MVYSIKETINETVNQQAETPSNTKETKAVSESSSCCLSVVASIVHQVHWYMRGLVSSTIRMDGLIG